MYSLSELCVDRFFCIIVCPRYATNIVFLSCCFCRLIVIFLFLVIPTEIDGILFTKITRTISAHEQHIVGPWLKTFPKKVSLKGWDNEVVLLAY